MAHFEDAAGNQVTPEDGVRRMWKSAEQGKRFIPNRAPGGWRTWLEREMAFEIVDHRQRGR